MSEELKANNDQLLVNERELQENLERNTFLSDVLDRSSQPFGVGYLDGRLGIVNHAFEELTGYTADELQRMDWTATLTPPEWLDVERKNLEELHRTGKPVRYEKEYIKKDGTRVAIELLAHLVADREGNPQYYYSFITDITEQKRNREILSLSNQVLHSAEEHHTLQPLLEEYIRTLQGTPDATRSGFGSSMNRGTSLTWRTLVSPVTSTNRRTRSRSGPITAYVST